MCNSDNNSADGAGVNPDKQQLLRQLKAGESVLTRVRQEKNNLQDANTQLGEELKDVRAQLSDSVKENRRLGRGIFSKCLNESSKKSSARKSIDRVMSAYMMTGRLRRKCPVLRGTFSPSYCNCTNEFGRRCKVSSRLCGHPSPCPKALKSLQRS